MTEGRVQPANGGRGSVDARRLSLPVWVLVPVCVGLLASAFAAGGAIESSGDAMRGVLEKLGAIELRVADAPTESDVRLIFMEGIRPLEQSVAALHAEMRALSSRVERSETEPIQDR